MTAHEYMYPTLNMYWRTLNSQFYIIFKQNYDELFRFSSLSIWVQWLKKCEMNTKTAHIAKQQAPRGLCRLTLRKLHVALTK